jgi:hypothetical protein
MLSMHCAGPFSEPTPTECDKRFALLMPFNHEKLVSAAKHAGWFVTAVTPPGVNPPECAVLCRDCARMLIPELVEPTEKVWAEGFGAGKEKGS